MDAAGQPYARRGCSERPKARNDAADAGRFVRTPCHIFPKSAIARGFQELRKE
jgi:hypothetical protein